MALTRRGRTIPGVLTGRDSERASGQALAAPRACRHEELRRNCESRASLSSSRRRAPVAEPAHPCRERQQAGHALPRPVDARHRRRPGRDGRVLGPLVVETAPDLVAPHGVGRDTAGALVAAAGDNSDRSTTRRRSPTSVGHHRSMHRRASNTSPAQPWRASPSQLGALAHRGHPDGLRSPPLGSLTRRHRTIPIGALSLGRGMKPSRMSRGGTETPALPHAYGVSSGQGG